jgi:hypothetical protein
MRQSSMWKKILLVLAVVLLVELARFVRESGRPVILWILLMGLAAVPGIALFRLQRRSGC